MKRHSRLMSCAVLSTPPSGGRRSAYTAPPASVSRYVRFERPPETSSNSTGKVRPSTCEASQRPTRPELTPAAAAGATSAIAQLGQRRLNLGAGDVLSAEDDHVLHPVHDMAQRGPSRSVSGPVVHTRIETPRIVRSPSSNGWPGAVNRPASAARCGAAEEAVIARPLRAPEQAPGQDAISGAGRIQDQRLHNGTGTAPG